ncbi:hypothetical protein, partial [Nannocystis pusilla]|uniref:hypothetical protein n=1 Tax=Nannocystis pusilla TaxID=889268 RepID=UPI003BF2B91A
AALVLGEALKGQSRWRDAVTPFERAITIWRALGNNPELLAYAKLGLAESLCHLPDRRFDGQQTARDIFSAASVIEGDAELHTRKQQLTEICRLL